MPLCNTYSLMDLACICISWKEIKWKERKGSIKINLGLHQHYHALNAIYSSMKESVYLVIIIATIKEVISMEEIKFLDMKDKATTIADDISCF